MLITIVLIVMDVLWALTMRNVWANTSASKVKSQWAIFDHLRSITLFFSYINIVIKAYIVATLVKLTRK